MGGRWGVARCPPSPPPSSHCLAENTGGEARVRESILFALLGAGSGADGRLCDCARAEPSESPWQANVSRGCPHGLLVLLPRIASRFTGPLSRLGQHDSAQPRLNRASRAPSGVLGGEACKAPPPHPSGVAMLGSSSTSTQLPGNPPSGPSPQKRKQNQQQHGGLLCSPPSRLSSAPPVGGVFRVRLGGWVGENPPPAGALALSSGGAAHRQGAPPRLTRFCLGVHQAPAQRVVR